MLSEQEQRVVDAIEDRRDELVALLTDLISFDTTARVLGDAPRDEAALQQYLGGRLEARGAETDLWEAPPGDVPASRMIPAGVDFVGRPQLLARFAGSGGGRSLLLNGHIDVVAVQRDQWSSDPNRAEIQAGRLYGRGACDMKGGIAAMVFATEVLAGLGVGLRGDLLVNTVTDEESWGAGGLASVAHGVRADAAIVTEPTGGDVWVACRGSLMPTVYVEGRPGHAGVHPLHWREGGSVNAIDKAMYVLTALRGLMDEWRDRPDQRHPHLSHGDIVPCLIRGGDWQVTHPASCSVSFHVAYLPAQADADGWGTLVEREIEDWIARAAAADPWLAQHPPRVEWSVDVPPSEIAESEPVVGTTLTAVTDVGWSGRVSGMDSWHDGASYTIFGGTPAICLGPGSLDIAHQTDEFVPVSDLVSCCQALAVAAMRFCGVTA